ncbi:MAG: response regulator [Firmicutes bacterium]|nr:response regulator [Bacillota bacterium]MDY5335528.1 response regulator [Bacilli bacterium]
MYTGIYFLIEAIVYSMLLMTVYFRKKVFKSKENKVYSILVVVSFFELIVELILDFVGPMYKEIPNVSYFVARLFSFGVELWITILLCYVLFVCLSIKKKERYIPVVRNIAIVLMIIFTTLNFILPLNFKYDGYIAYTYGPSVNIIYLSAFLYSFIGIIALIRNIKNIKDKRFFPILIFLIVGGIASYIQYMNPGLLLATPIHAFITFLMYFTIENPDVKMIEEYHKAKEISDNANEDKTMFLYNMTNDIRLITKDINYNTDAAINEMSNKKVDKDLVNDYLRAIKENTARFTTMTNEILDVDSIDSASIKVYDDKYNIKLLLKKIVTLYSDECSKKGLTFRSDIASDLPEYLYGDNLGLKNVLISILDNSIKYTKEGYIELNVNTIIKNNIARLIIIIEDSGVGISPDEMDSIFYKRKEEIDGSNMKSNLFTARKLITLMGGTIIPSSNYGNGTTMKIVLDQKIVEEANEKYNKYESFYDEKKILLVDDNISTEKIISKLIRDTNIKLDYVSLGKEALDKIRGKEKYDLILLDEVMDPLDGVTVMKKFKDIRNFKTNVILLTRNNEYEYNEEYLKYGFSGYLLKPISKDKLFEIIDKYLK